MSKIVPLEGFGGGSSSPLNFKIVAYATEEELAAAPQPAENTIGVVTTNTITSWIFDAIEPTDPIEGMVWFTIGTSSAVAFNALKKNSLQVYPLSAKQYVDGAWVDVTAKSYHDGEWVDWITWLYKDGKFFEDLTGTISKIYSSDGSTKLTYNETNINLVSNRGNGIYAFANLFDLSGKSKLCFEYALSGSGSYACDVRVTSTKSVTSFSSNLIAKKTFASATSGVTEYEIDISSVDSGYIGFSGTIATQSDSFNFTIYKLWLE